MVETDLFDIYENDERKSLAFHLIFQSPEKPNRRRSKRRDGKIFAAIEANDDWEVRK